MTDQLWAQWQSDWRAMAAIARERGWELTPLAIAGPVDESKLRQQERANGMPFPPQLRDLLTGYASRVAFGWRIPSHHRPMERIEHLYPTTGGIRDHIWNFEFINAYAIPNFHGWKRELAGKDISEAKNEPAMWERQFPFGHLMNGDILTIDVSKPDGRQQPVRYFSHDLEGLHAHELAPDFFTFVSVYASLGAAGQTHDDWFRFIEKTDVDKRVAHLSATGAGAKAWLNWRDGGIDERHPDDPPPSVLGTTTADRALLMAAHQNALPGVTAALAAGAKPDGIWNPDWGNNPLGWGDGEFWTALTHAVDHDNLEMVDLLLKRGATLNTRHLPLNTAVQQSSFATIKGLIERGARVNGWRHQRHWPLHILVNGRGKVAGYTKAEYKAHLEEQSGKYGQYGAGAGVFSSLDASKLARHVEAPVYDGMLETLLIAGAAPDAPWDNGITMLMYGGVETGKRLLKHGASVHARNVSGMSVLHWAQTPEKVKLIVEHGADVDVVATPRPEDVGARPFTPLQSALLSSGRSGLELAATLLRLGADPKKRDGIGRTTLAYCPSEAALTLIRGHGLNPKELQPEARTLLHNLVDMWGAPRANNPAEVEFFEHLLSLGLDINARDTNGQTMLHLIAARADYDGAAVNMELLIAHGADKTMKDNAGRRAFDLAAKSLEKIRAVLR